jgi:hypothetical protein
MNLRNWFAARGLKFVVQRASKLIGRYGFSSQRSINRIEGSMQILAKYGCTPTFFTPGIVVERYPKFIQKLQSEGAEIAVHSYQHIDLKALKLADAIDQLNKAMKIYEKNGIENHGFRCPYLSCSEELLDALPEGMFNYSSNRAIWVAVPALDRAVNQNIIFDTLRRFYQPQLSSDVISTPRVRSNLFELPVCVPDDLQLHDGINLDPEGIAEVWIEMLGQMHHKGELFNLIFHPELGSICQQSFADTLQQAALLKPAVWVSKLCDVSNWWKEKSDFDFKMYEDALGLQVNFLCTSRATILARGLASLGSQSSWDGSYFQLKDRVIRLPVGIRPLIGLEQDVPLQTASFLKQQGYLVDTSNSAVRCSIYFDHASIIRLGNDMELVKAIESSNSPLLRYWRWPDGAKCAFTITGDLDAITLFDYASRLITQ